jgi:hypothetical protein
MKRTFKDLREQYGKGKSDQAMNAAIRAEMPGGEGLINAIGKVHVATVAGCKDLGGVAEELRKAKDDMAAAVMRKGRWEVEDAKA